MPLRSWRLLLPELPDSPMDLDEELFQALLALEEKRLDQPYNWDEASSWAMDQNHARLTVFFDDDTEISARMQIVGTFNGETFMWAWANQTIDARLRVDSLKLKEHGESNGWTIFSQEEFPATARDAYAMMALAAEFAGADGAYAGESVGTATYVILFGLPKQAVPSTDQPEFGPPSVIDHLNGLIAQQLNVVRLGLRDLRDIESVCRRGYVQSLAGHHVAAAESYDEAWSMLGEFAADQEPASWIKLAKGNALFLAGLCQEALNTLQEAEQLFDCPDIVLLYQRMGQSYLALEMNKQAMDIFARVYVGGGEEALKELGSTEREPFLKELKSRRSKARKAILNCEVKAKTDKRLEEAEAIVTCLIEELNEFETNAHKLEEKARKKRINLSESCEEDLVVQDQINTKWAWLLAVWCTQNRWPLCNSIQFPPQHDPKTESIKTVRRNGDDKIAVETSSHDSFGGSNSWRYELEENDGELLISQIYSVWDDEETPCL